MQYRKEIVFGKKCYEIFLFYFFFPNHCLRFVSEADAHYRIEVLFMPAKVVQIQNVLAGTRTSVRVVAWRIITKAWSPQTPSSPPIHFYNSFIILKHFCSDDFSEIFLFPSLCVCQPVSRNSPLNLCWTRLIMVRAINQPADGQQSGERWVLYQLNFLG